MQDRKLTAEEAKNFLDNITEALECAPEQLSYVEMAAAGLTGDAFTFMQPIVSHTTGTFDNVQSILKDGIRLNVDLRNKFIDPTFYVSEGGFSINEVEGKHTVTFRMSNSIKIYDATASNEKGSRFIQNVRNNGYDAIKYENHYCGKNLAYSKANNLAIVNNPQKLTPTGVYPVPEYPGIYTGISIPTIRGIQVFGAAGTGYALYHAGKSIKNSEKPIVEAAYQASLFGAAVAGGIKGGALAITPCASVGAYFPLLAPYTVPVCIAGGSLTGAFVATSATDAIWKYSGAICKGTVNGISAISKSIMHPIDNVILPVGSFFNDLRIIHVANNPGYNTDLYSLEDACQYYPAKKRIQERWLTLKKSVDHFAQASQYEKVEILTSLGVTSLLPGTIFNGMGKMGVNYCRYGIIKNPIEYRSIFAVKKVNPRDFSISVNEFRNLVGETFHKFVVTTDGRFHISKHISPGANWLKHPELVNDAKAIAAGEAEGINGFIKSMNDMTGHFQITSKDHSKIAEHAAIKAGYSEAKGKFTSYLKDWLRSGDAPVNYDKRKPLFNISPIPNYPGTKSEDVLSGEKIQTRGYESYIPDISFISSASAASSIMPASQGSQRSFSMFTQPPVRKTIVQNKKLPPHHSTAENTHTNAKLEKIYKNNADVTTKVSQMLSEIHTSYQAIHQVKLLQEQQQRVEIARTRFDAVTQGFTFLGQIGHETGNKSLERIGAMGVSLAQGTFNIAELTGAFGVPVVTGASMVLPMIGIGTAMLSLGSMLFRSKQKNPSKAMNKMVKALSSQIIEMHRDMNKMNSNMMNGFNAVMMGLDKINENLGIGFSSLHEEMSRHFSNNTKQLSALAEFSQLHFARINKGIEAILESQINIFELVKRDYIELDYKLDDQNIFLNKMDGRLNEILAELQKSGFKEETAAKNKMFSTLEQLELVENVENKNLLLCKLLQSIRNQLLVASNSLKSLEVKGNSFSGWYHLGSLSCLFSEPEFHNFPLDYEHMTNYQWSQSANDCFFTLLSRQDFSHPKIKCLKSEILSILEKTIKPTNQLIQILADENFLNTFFVFHRKKMVSIHARAEMILKNIRENMSELAMRNYARHILAEFQQSNHKEALLKLVKENTEGMSRQVTQYAEEELISLTKEYNHCIQNFKTQTNIIFSLLEIDAVNMKAIKRKFDELQPVSELCHRSRGVLEIRHDTLLPEGAIYSRVEIDTTNHFKSIEITSEDLSPLLNDAKEYADMTKAYLDLVSSVTSTDETTALEFVDPIIFQPIEFKPHEETMRSTLNTTTMDKLIKSMELVFDIAQQAKGKTPYYVMGMTGDGKSTFINCLNGSRYKEVPGRLGKMVPEIISDSQPEICEVGRSIARSGTTLPQLIEVPYGDRTMTYCDLPGLDGTGDKATTYCEAHAPMVLNEQVANVGGIIWVLSVDQIMATKSEKIKIMLQNLLKISKSNPEVLAKSLTLVVTKGSKLLNKKDVADCLMEIVESMINTEEKEKELLTEILANITREDSKQIVITQIFDTDSQYLEELQQAVMSHEKPFDKNLFDFSAYCKAQDNFREELDTAIKQHKNLVSDYENLNRQVIQSSTKFELISKAKEEAARLHGKLDNKLKNHVHSLAEKQHDVIHLQTKIDQIKSNLNLIEVGKIKHAISPLTHEIEIDEPTGGYNYKDSGRFENLTRKEYRRKETVNRTQALTCNFRFGCVRFEKWANLHRAQGYTIEPVVEDRGRGVRTYGYACAYQTVASYDEVDVPYQSPIRIEEPITRKVKKVEPLPLGNPAEYNLSFPSSIPLIFDIVNRKGWTVKANPVNNANGYQETIVYEEGLGCEIEIVFNVSYENSELGQQELDALRLEKDTLDKQIHHIKTLTGEWSSQIEQYQKTITAANMQLPVFKKQTVQHDNDLKELTRYMESRERDFKLLNILSATFNKQDLQRVVINKEFSDKPLSCSSENANNKNISAVNFPDLLVESPVVSGSGELAKIAASTFVYSSKNKNNKTTFFPKVHINQFTQAVLSKILQNAENASAQEYIEIISFSDSNCCFNSFALGLLDLIYQNQTISSIPMLVESVLITLPVLEKRKDRYRKEISPFIAPLESWINFIKTLPDSSSFISYIKNIRQQDQASITALQFALAPALREMGVKNHLQKVKQENIGEYEINDANRLKEDQSWAGHESLHALADIFHVNIDIKTLYSSFNQSHSACYKTASGINNQLPVKFDCPTLTMLNLNGIHWNYLIPKEQQNGLASYLPSSKDLAINGQNTFLKQPDFRFKSIS